jgi:hypothetical protein
VVKLTLSENQAEWIRAMSLSGVEARVESWSDHVPVAPAQRSFGLLAAGSHSLPRCVDWGKPT